MKSQKASVIDIAVEASQKIFFDHKKVAKSVHVFHNGSPNTV
jgi:hypothetical protein